MTIKRCGRSLTLAALSLLAARAVAPDGAARAQAAPVTQAQTVPAPVPGGRALWQMFLNPPDDARPLMRWWWFGPAVENAEIEREIAAMQAGGFGGFEIQPTYPLSPDDSMNRTSNWPFLSAPFLSALRHAHDVADARGLRMDVTLGSGWPFGGAHVPINEAASELRRVTLPLAVGASSVRLPQLEPGERHLAAFAAGHRLILPAAGDLRLAPSSHDQTIVLFLQGRTGQQVKRPALGAEGYVLDHLSTAAVKHYLKSVGDRLLSAFVGTRPPFAMFSDSLEAYGSSWTDDLPNEFRRRRGYDLLDHLPALFSGNAQDAAVRYDWARTLSELVDERYLGPITAWARSHGTRFRAQVYGVPPPTLSSNALVDLPEGEGADWRAFNSTRWATSAAHLYDRPVVSAETWTWLHSPAWAATPLDMKVEADRQFLQGVNQIVGHGWPYSPPQAGEPGYAFYAAAALNDHNLWYPAMPAVTRYLQRVSALLRAGRPDPQIAIYLPTEDVFANLTPQHASANDALGKRLNKTLVGQVIDAGQELDFIDSAAITGGKLKHRLLILPEITRVDAKAYEAILVWARRGGIVISVGELPVAGGGKLDGGAATQRVATISRELRQLGADRLRIVAPSEIRTAVAALLPPLIDPATPTPTLGFIRRQMADGFVYFVVNTGATPIHTAVQFAGDNGRGTWWDPMQGQAFAAGSGAIVVTLAPYESRLLAFLDGLPAAPRRNYAEPRFVQDLSTAWQARTAAAVTAPPPGRSWTDDPALRHFSGSVVYERRLNLRAGTVRPGERLLLDFGADRPSAAGTAERPVAALEAPVRDAAIVRVNGKEAGTVWAPPWRLDVTHLLHAGSNRIEVRVMNSALNALSADGARKVRLLNMRYGERFKDQDQDKIVPQPSGLLGAITLRSVQDRDVPALANEKVLAYASQ